MKYTHEDGAPFSKEELVLKLTDEERTCLVEREKYLISQRDEFIEDFKSRTNK